MIAEQFKRDFVDLNPDVKFKILSFEFEMLAMDQVARSVSGKTGISTRKLYSGQNFKIGDAQLAEIEEHAKSVSDYPIYTVDNLCTVAEIQNTILSFVHNEEIDKNEKKLVITIDHLLLTKGRQGQQEKQVIDDLCKMLIGMKKILKEMYGIDVIIIMLSQLNRDIESMERVMNPKVHYPTKNDLFGSSYIYQASDYVLVSHNPSEIEGIDRYGPPRGTEYPLGLPKLNPNDKNQPMIYWHLIKSRFGQKEIMMMIGKFAESKIVDY
jgi:replicative DNA helicase